MPLFGNEHSTSIEPLSPEISRIENRYRRRWLPAILLMLMLLPLIGAGAHQTMHSMLTMPSRWLPVSLPERKSLDRFVKEFESGDSVLLSWPGCTIDDPRLAEIEAAVNDIRKSADHPEQAAYFDETMSGYTVLRELMGPPLGLSREEALQRLQGSLVGPDGKFSCIVIALTERGLNERRQAIPLILTEAARVCDIAEEEFLLAGPPVEGAFLDNEATFDANTLSIPSTIVSALLCWWCLGSWRYTAVVLATALFGQGLVLAGMHWFDVRMNALLIVLPTLVLVLTVSAGVHLVNYYYDAVRNFGVSGAASRALGSGRRPCLLAAFTTAMGLLSLCVSDIEPIVRFGIFAAVGVLTTIGLLLYILPGALVKWPAQPRRSAAAPSSATGERPRRSDRFLDAMAGGISRYAWFLSLLFVGSAAAAGYGLQKIETSIAFDSLFPADSRISRDYQFLERHLGPLAPVEVILHFCKESSLVLSERLDVVSRVERAIRNVANIEGTLSGADLTPEIPRTLTPDEQTVAMQQRLTFQLDETPAKQLPPTVNLKLETQRAATAFFSHSPLLTTVSMRHSTFRRGLQFADIPEDSAPQISPPQTVEALRAFSWDSSQRSALKPPTVFTDDSGFPPIPTYEIPPWELIEARTIQSISDEVRDQLIRRKYLHETADRQSFRISARVPALLGIDYHQSLLDLQHAVDPLLAELGPEASQTVSAEYTGVMPVVSKAQRVLLKDLYGSFLTAFGMVAIVMVFVLRSFTAGMIAMLPNVFPAIVVFGLMGWLEIPVDIGAMITASVALGIAVDDTLHFLTWFRIETAQGCDRREAVRLCLRHCARAMMQTTMICGLGMMVFAFSGFVPSQRFSWLMFTLLTATLAGDLILLPALLSSSMGKLFVPKPAAMGKS